MMIPIRLIGTYKDDVMNVHGIEILVSPKEAKIAKMIYPRNIDANTVVFASENTMGGKVQIEKVGGDGYSVKKACQIAEMVYRNIVDKLSEVEKFAEVQKMYNEISKEVSL